MNYGLSSKITPAEFKIIVLAVVLAYSWEQTAAALGVGVPTVASHWRAISIKQRVPVRRDARVWILRQLLGLEWGPRVSESFERNRPNFL